MQEMIFKVLYNYLFITTTDFYNYLYNYLKTFYKY